MFAEMGNSLGWGGTLRRSRLADR